MLSRYEDELIKKQIEMISSKILGSKDLILYSHPHESTEGRVHPDSTSEGIPFHLTHV